MTCQVYNAYAYAPLGDEQVLKYTLLFASLPSHAGSKCITHPARRPDEMHVHPLRDKDLPASKS